MGVLSVLGRPPSEVARETAGTTEAEVRRMRAQERMDLYYDKVQGLVESEIASFFDSENVRRLVRRMVRATGSVGVFKRIVDDIARLVYVVPPVREVSPDSDQESYTALLKECRANSKLDLAARVIEAANSAFLFPRYSASLGRMTLDVLWPSMVEVIPHPDDQTVALGFMYKTRVRRRGSLVDAWVYWDDVETMLLSDSFEVFTSDDGRAPTIHPYGRIPVVEIHAFERSGSYWIPSERGDDLKGAHIGEAFLRALTFRLHKSQGWRQLVLKGDMDAVPQDQILVEEGPLMVGEGVEVTTLDLATDPGHYLKTIEEIRTSTAANHGINRDRLNQKTTSPSDDAALMERRADLIKVFFQAEHDMFDVFKLVSQEHPSLRLSDEASLRVDFAELESRVDRKTQLELREMEERRALRNVLDDIREDQPEISTEEEAREEYLKNLEIRAWRIEQERALNSPRDIDNNGPGQDPKVNGAKGPAVRDAKSEDDEDIQAIVQEVIGGA